jgi:hypothetical protein
MRRVIFLLITSFLLCRASFALTSIMGQEILTETLQAVSAMGYGPCDAMADTGPTNTVNILTKSFQCKDRWQLVASMVQGSGKPSHLSAIGLWVAPESKTAIPRGNAKLLADQLLALTEKHLGLLCTNTGEKYREGGSLMFKCVSKIKNKALPAWNVRYTDFSKFPVDASNRRAAMDFQFFLEPEKN